MPPSRCSRSDSADTLRGTQKEFEAIIAVVIGGTLLTGGYGSAVGAFLGALIFGTVQIGIFYTGIDTDWFKVFLGLMVLAAVLFNNYRAPPRHAGPLIGMATAASPIVELKNVSKTFGTVLALRGRLLRRLPRRGALPAGRQWRRQVDPDQDPRRRSSRPRAATI